MAWYDDMLKGGNIVTGLALAVGAAIVLPIALPMIRPVAKGAIKVGLLAYDATARVIGELGEQTTDLIAEAQHEYAVGNHNDAQQSASQARPTNNPPTSKTIITPPFNDEPETPDELRTAGSA